MANLKQLFLELQLLLRFKWEGFEARELAGENAGSTTNAVQMRLKKIIKRLDQQPFEGAAN